MRAPASALVLRAPAGDGLSHVHVADASAPRKAVWRPQEDFVILSAVRHFGTQWSRIAAQLPGRTEDAVRNRWHRLQKVYSGVEEGGVTDEAKWMLAAAEATVKSAAAVPDNGDSGRHAWSAEEDRIILEGVETHGQKWRMIVRNLPGRSDSSARNRWMRLKKEREAAAASTDTPSTSIDTPAVGGEVVLWRAQPRVQQNASVAPVQQTTSVAPPTPCAPAVAISQPLFGGNLTNVQFMHSLGPVMCSPVSSSTRNLYSCWGIPIATAVPFSA